MIIKKVAQIGLLMLLPLTSFSLSLVTHNNTNEDSSVYISSSKSCSGPTYATKAHSSLTTPIFMAKVLCSMLRGGVCKATMFASNNCQGEKVADIELNLDNGFITSFTPASTKYKIYFTNTKDVGSDVTVSYNQ